MDFEDSESESDNSQSESEMAENSCDENSEYDSEAESIPLNEEDDRRIREYKKIVHEEDRSEPDYSEYQVDIQVVHLRGLTQAKH